jgi:hypothetical protein
MMVCVVGVEGGSDFLGGWRACFFFVSNAAKHRRIQKCRGKVLL